MARRAAAFEIDAAPLDEAAPYIAMFNASAEASLQARADAERDEDYYNNKQLTATEAKQLRARGQPEVTNNLIRRKVDYILGLERQTRTDPKAFPRTKMEEGSAEAATDALRYVADRGRFPQVKSKVTRNILIHGYGGCYVRVVEKGGRYDVVFTYIPWDRLFYDPHSAEPDFSDARYVGFVTWYDYDEAARKFPEGVEALEGSRSEEATGTYDDKPKYLAWTDAKRKRVRVAEMYIRRDNVWHYVCFTRGGLLRPVQPVTYLDDNGEPECPLILASAYVDRDNNRAGIVRDLVPIQDEINKRRSKALHLITMRQAAIRQGSGLDPNKVRAELAKPDGVIEVPMGSGSIDDTFKLLDTNDMAAGNLGLLQDAKADMTMFGPNAAMQGKDPRQQSGRAIQAQQQGGAIELAPILDGLRDWQQRVMRQAWNRVRQFWDAPMWVRVTDDDEGLKFVGLNQPVTLGDKVREMQEAGQPIPPEIEQAVQMNPAALEQVIGTRNDVGKLDVDIIIDEQPDVVTLQGEAFETLAKAAAAGMPVPPDILIEAAPLPHKIKRTMLEKMQEAAQQPPQVDPALELKAAETKAKIEADAAKTQADLQMKQLEIEAERERMAFERQKAQEDRAFEVLKMQHETAKMQMERENMLIQREMTREGAIFARQKRELDIQARREAASAN